jgi:hypothetical protein
MSSTTSARIERLFRKADLFSLVWDEIDPVVSDAPTHNTPEAAEAAINEVSSQPAGSETSPEDDETAKVRDSFLKVIKTRLAAGVRRVQGFLGFDNPVDRSLTAALKRGVKGIRTQMSFRRGSFNQTVDAFWQYGARAQGKYSLRNWLQGIVGVVVGFVTWVFLTASLIVGTLLTFVLRTVERLVLAVVTLARAIVAVVGVVLTYVLTAITLLLAVIASAILLAFSGIVFAVRKATSWIAPFAISFRSADRVSKRFDLAAEGAPVEPSPFGPVQAERNAQARKGHATAKRTARKAHLRPVTA